MAPTSGSGLVLGMVPARAMLPTVPWAPQCVSPSWRYPASVSMVVLNPTGDPALISAHHHYQGRAQGCLDASLCPALALAVSWWSHKGSGTKSKTGLGTSCVPLLWHLCMGQMGGCPLQPGAHVPPLVRGQMLHHGNTSGHRGAG